MTKKISSKPLSFQPATPGETIGAWVYYRDDSGDLYRVPTKSFASPPKPELIVPSVAAEFALRSARLAAGLPEHGTAR